MQAQRAGGSRPAPRSVQGGRPWARTRGSVSALTSSYCAALVSWNSSTSTCLQGGVGQELGSPSQGRALRRKGRGAPEAAQVAVAHGGAGAEQGHGQAQQVVKVQGVALTQRLLIPAQYKGLRESVEVEARVCSSVLGMRQGRGMAMGCKQRLRSAAARPPPAKPGGELPVLLRGPLVHLRQVRLHALSHCLRGEGARAARPVRPRGPLLMASSQPCTAPPPPPARDAPLAQRSPTARLGRGRVPGQHAALHPPDGVGQLARLVRHRPPLELGVILAHQAGQQAVRHVLPGEEAGEGGGEGEEEESGGGVGSTASEAAPPLRAPSPRHASAPALTSARTSKQARAQPGRQPSQPPAPTWSYTVNCGSRPAPGSSAMWRLSSR